VFSYYSDLKQSPGPAVPVRICAAEACQAVGARALAKAWREQCEGDPQLAQDTGVDEPVYCLGNCALGPAALVNGELVGRAGVQALVDAVAAARSGESS
jgi:formate dehydrogenase subunit gamma